MVWGIGPGLILSKAQKSAEANTPNHAGGVGDVAGSNAERLQSVKNVVMVAPTCCDTTRILVQLRFDGGHQPYKHEQAVTFTHKFLRDFSK
jgi:hypothetical protein